MIFVRPGLGIGLTTGPVVTSGLGLVLVVIIEVTPGPIYSKKPLTKIGRLPGEKRRYQTATAIGVVLPTRTVEVATGSLRRQLPVEIRSLPSVRCHRMLPERIDNSVGTRRSRMNPERKQGS